jgi:hypothetical protein
MTIAPSVGAILCGQIVDEYEPGSDSAKEFASLSDAIEGVL